MPVSVAPWQVLAAGLQSPEGPVPRPDGSVVLVESTAGAVTVVGPDGAATRIAHTEGAPNGLAAAPDGSLLVADNGGFGRAVKHPGSLRRVATDGTVDTLAGGLDAPNDVCVADAVYFTDPRDSWFDETLRPGRIYRWHAGTTTVVHEGLAYPNGIAVDTSGRLVVAESRTGWLHVLDGDAIPWARCPEGAPDGLCFSADGHCVVCCFDAGMVFVLDASGAVVDRMPTGHGTWPTNCALDATGRLVVTESRQGRLLALDVGLWPA